MNQYTELLKYLRELASSNPLVNTVTKGLISELDLEKANVFPLVHIGIASAGFTNGATITFNVSLECLADRDISKEVVTDKFWKQDNEVDNHNETLAILNNIWMNLLRDWADKNITVPENAPLTKITFEKGNLLDGWALDFTVEMPNTELSLC